MANRAVKIFVVNDFACHFCYIGHIELLQAISYCKDSLNLPLTVEVEYRPFRLINCLKEFSPGIDRTTFYMNKMGKEKFEATESAIDKWTKESGVPISFNGPMSQTIWAHRLSLKAFNIGGQALQLPLLTALFKAYFEEKKDIGDINLLADISEEVGVMTKGEAIEFLQSNLHEDEVLKMTEEAKAKGITGVPVYVIDGRWVLKGGQSASVFIEIFKKLASGASSSRGSSPFMPQLHTTTQCC
ncbi:hypothetical protein PC9H_009565 [Pleurotus ostreatus]|uniref:DSBA-like thioredoxin domain-containing protein n=3 Tax=Pleurotus TaxID=5320 RepID=A0A067NK85_PLEO1|nr:uncharacterized protein PC9H_009565 [Pleurotus ostreatus]KAF7424259.1 hypothetical protein PC9H_009565 [Pleurotus ostreatus]KAG9224712.1 hypothetical protein CCMSSC00406_0002137 [Pleurotus cornucopiae]KAJ8692863.1 hypothetical protein PTI98_010133 [Pleurotus ostreatus]KDQ24512.1 hypothetical protein PLEOSDRAFT_1097745 [Pleurotus ostreatus PC15]